MLSFGAGDNGGLTEPLVPMALGLAYATMGVGLVYGLVYSTTVRWAFLAGTVFLVPASARVVSAYRLRRRDVAALGGLVLLLVPYVLYLQIDRHLELVAPYVLVAATTFVVPALAGAAFGYETRRLPAVRTGPGGYLRGLSRYVAVGVAPSMVTSGFVGSAAIGTAGGLSRTDYVLIYTVTGLLMTAVAVSGALVGYTAGYAVRRHGAAPD